MPSNSFSRRRGNWRRPIVCISKKKPLEEDEPGLTCQVSARWSYNWFFTPNGSFSHTNPTYILGLPGVDPWSRVWSWIDNQSHVASMIVTFTPLAPPSGVISYGGGSFGVGGTSSPWPGTCLGHGYTLALTISPPGMGAGNFEIIMNPP